MADQSHSLGELRPTARRRHVRNGRFVAGTNVAGRMCLLRLDDSVERTGCRRRAHGHCRRARDTAQQFAQEIAPKRAGAIAGNGFQQPEFARRQLRSCLIFFLLHEQPSQYRERTLSELFRVVKPGGKIIVVDYDLPRWWHPVRYVWRPLLAKLEPFALDLWRNEIAKWLPQASSHIRKQPFFGGLYQKMVITR